MHQNSIIFSISGLQNELLYDICLVMDQSLEIYRVSFVKEISDHKTPGGQRVQHLSNQAMDQPQYFLNHEN